MSASPPPSLTSHSLLLFHSLSSSPCALQSSRQCRTPRSCRPFPQSQLSSPLLTTGAPTARLGPWVPPPNCKAKACNAYHLLSPTPCHPSPFHLSSGFTYIQVILWIPFTQSNKNSRGHQICTSRELIWLQRKPQHYHESARMGIPFCTLVKSATSIPPYPTRAPA